MKVKKIGSKYHIEVQDDDGEVPCISFIENIETILKITGRSREECMNKLMALKANIKENSISFSDRKNAILFMYWLERR